MGHPGLRLLVADVRDDLSRFHLLHYGRTVDGFLVSGHNCGTHWLRFMLSAAIAHKLDLPGPKRSSGPQSGDFIANARHPRRHPQAPVIGSSHHMPSRLVAALGRLGLYRLPPVVVLVRNIPDALTSYFCKWRNEKALGGLGEYVGRGPSPQGVDLWWYIRFFNRWGLLRAVFPDQVLVVRYEDLQSDPDGWVRRIWAHWGVELSDADVAAAVALSSREAVAERLDPAYGETIVPERQVRGETRLSWDEGAVVGLRLVAHLRCDFGYSARLRRRRQAAREALLPEPA
jgi:hypothetical protein